MSNEKVKSENYTNLGGINSKASPYLTSPFEFLDLKNFDFFTPGSLCERWGSTMYVGQTFNAPPTMIDEYQKLSGASYVIIGTSTGLWYGATTGQNQGMSFSYFGQTWASLNTPTISWPLYDFRMVGSSFRGNASSLPVPYQGDTSNNFVVTPFLDHTWGASGNVSQGVVFNDWFFAADGDKFWKFDGSTAYIAQLAPPVSGDGAGSGTSFAFTSDNSRGDILGLTGTYFFYLAYVNNRGVQGPVWPVAAIDTTTISGSTAAGYGGTFIAAGLGMVVPPWIGASSINVYTWWSASSLRINAPFPWLNTPRFLKNVAVGSGPTFTSYVAFGSSDTAGWQAIVNGTNAVSDLPDYIAQGLSAVYVGPGAANGITGFVLNSYSPRFLEIYQNRLFMAGFSSTPSLVWFSDVGEPEGVQADWNFEVRTNDGDAITCLKSYATSLYVFKKRSFHVLSGDSPDNFFLREITDNYGCLNSNCAVTVENILYFLDQKGIVMWTGAQIQMLSSKVQPFFDRMNYQVALTSACMVHDKLRNQILIGIPIDGSATNNITLVYDYLAGSWTTYNGFTPSIFAVVRGRNNTKNAFYGDAQGRVNWFGPSFLADNGVGFTTYFKTRFLHDMGESTQKMFRRMFLNADSPASSTLVFNANFYQDYGSSVVLGTTIVLSQFQNRIDFGISAKSVAFELANIQTVLPLRVHGFTIESRFMRKV